MASLDPDSLAHRQFLRKFPLFGRLSDHQLDQVLGLMEEFTFDAEATLVPSGHPADQAWFVLEGCLVSQPTPETPPLYVGPGEVWGLLDLLHPSVSPGPLRTMSAGRVLIWRHATLIQGLKRHLGLRSALAPQGATGFSAALWPELVDQLEEKISRRHFLVQTGQRVEVFVRRSGWLLALHLVGPVGVFLAAAGLGLNLTARTASLQQVFWLWLLPGLLLLAAAVYGCLRLVEWRNNYLLLTEDFLIHKQLRLFQRISTFRKLPLSQIQNFEINRSGFLNFFLNLGTLSVKSSAWGGGMTFSQLPRPLHIEKRIRSRLQIRAADRTAQDRSLHQQVLEEQFGKVERLHAVPRPFLRQPEADFPLVSPNQRFFWRAEHQGVITYKKHPFLFFLKLAPWALSWTSCGLFFSLLWLVFPEAWNVLVALGLVASLVFGAKLWWEAVDWLNDHFQIDGNLVRAIHRRPLWLGEVRQETALDKIQEINLKKSGLLALLFDFGDLTILTAGQTQPLVFEMVGHPEWIQSEIFLKKLELETQHQAADQKAQLKEFAQFVDVYQQAIEQGMIPPPKSRD